MADRPKQSYRNEDEYQGQGRGGYNESYNEKGGNYREGGYGGKGGKYGGERRDGKKKYRNEEDKYQNYTEQDKIQMASEMGIKFVSDRPKFSNSKKISAQIENPVVPVEEHRTVIDTRKQSANPVIKLSMTY
jgi:hypothetical protein